MEVDPPDGGFQAWFIMVCSFLVNGIVFSIINTFGILFVKLKEDFEENGVEDAAFKCALVGSLAIGCTFFTSFFAGILSDKIGLKATSVCGGVLATLGLGLSAVFYHRIEVLYLTYGIMYGTGASLAYNPSLTILGQYFRKRLGTVNGVVTAGSSMFTILLSFTNPYILANHGVVPCLMFLTVLSSLLIICGFFFKPLSKQKDPGVSPDVAVDKTDSSFVKRFVHVENWQNKRFVVWALALPCALFGYFVPFVHLVQFAKNIPLHEDDEVNSRKAAYLMACIGVTSGLGRLMFGKISDMPSITKNGNRIVLQQVAFFAMGVCTMLITLAPLCKGWEYETLMLICCIMGLFDGCFVTLLGPIAFDLCGPLGAGQAIGTLLALFSLPMTVGPPIAGIIFDQTGSYTPAFLSAGVPPIVGSLLMIFIRVIPPNKDTPVKDQNGCQDRGSHLTEKTNSQPECYVVGEELYRQEKGREI